MKYLLVFAVIASGILAVTSTFADDAAQVPSNAKAPTAATKAQGTAPAPSQAPVDPGSRPQRSKSLSFDDSVVEGLNQNSKDSLEMVEKRDGRNRQHLYQKRADFKPEIKQFPSEMGYSP
jgi:hypothetical protein